MTRRIVYTAGVFDLFHAGHVEILEESAKLGDLLYVGVVSDEGTEAYKGQRPVFTEHERLGIVSAMRCVDWVFLQPGTDPSPVLFGLAAAGMTPAIMTHGDDWSELLEGNETLRELGIEFRIIPRTTGRFTSRLIEQIQTRASA
jgi:rfaE bifunctional protein nucleotidyltransferase chain/domain